MSTTSMISALALAVLAAPQADSGQSADATRAFSQEQLEQMVAPIALHPDPLLTQILMASTYPLEIVQADRWMQKNPGLQGAALEEALKTQPWDPSVKAMCGFPTVLKEMSENLDWTRDLGDAFLGQKTELMDTVQRMRGKALEAGTLKSTSQQKVEQDGKTIVIVPASPEVIYVPAYSPVVVYGPGWYYPYWYYPYWYYPPPYGGGFVTFSIGFYWTSGCWGYCDWPHHGVFVDAVAYRTFTSRTCSQPVRSTFLDAASGRVAWTHDPAHRKSVGYRSPQVASGFAGAAGTRIQRDRPRELERRGEAPRLEENRDKRRPDGFDAPGSTRTPQSARPPDGDRLGERRDRGYQRDPGRSAGPRRGDGPPRRGRRSRD